LGTNGKKVQKIYNTFQILYNLVICFSFLFSQIQDHCIPGRKWFKKQKKFQLEKFSRS
jgi:hypothetical protein